MENVFNNNADSGDMLKNQYEVTWKFYKEWLLEYKTKGRKLVFLIFWSIMALILLVASFWEGFSAIYFLVAVFCVYRAFFRDYISIRRQYNQLTKVHGSKSWMKTITISDTDIVISEGVTTVNCKTADVMRIIEKGDKIQLIMNNKMVVRMYKSAFVEGSWEACKELLYEICI